MDFDFPGIPDGFTFCAGCAAPTPYVYCPDCAVHAKCPHGEQLGECSHCDVDGDLAFDSAREA